jgi:Retrotransposon gag protein
MVYDTRNSPDFEFEVQKELYAARRHFSLRTGFPFQEKLEEKMVTSLDQEEAQESLKQTTDSLEKWEKGEALKKARKEKKPEMVDTPAGDDDIIVKKDPEGSGKGASETNPAKSKSGKKDKGKAVVGGSGDPDDSSGTGSNSDSDEEDPRKRASKEDKERIRGRTPRIETTKKQAKLIKMDSPKKYTGEKDNDRTYDAVHLFLSQLSRYFRLATYVDMESDISEYVLGYLDGFAYKWFEALNKGTEPFLWKHFEEKFRGKFIPREHVQLSMNSYINCKQRGRPVGEYMVEKESLENTLGNLLPEPLRESTFREGLDSQMRRRMEVFRDLPLDQYKLKAESID